METEERILEAAARLLEEQGIDGMTTRAVCQLAGITAPTLYHHYGDKNGLVRAVVTAGIDQFMAMKQALRVTDDPLADLRQGWDGWIAFGLERPALFRLMIEAARSDPGLLTASYQHMKDNVLRIESTRRLRVDASVAVSSVWAAASGMQALFAQGARRAEIESVSDFLFKSVLDGLVDADR
jgi:AcrR family transcriptional regulator